MRKKVFYYIATACIATLSLAVGLGPSGVAHASGPFRCQPGFYQVIEGQLNILNPLTGVYTPIGADQFDYNAIGFNPVDNYIYGWATDNQQNTNSPIKNNIIRVSSTGEITLMGNAGLTENYVSGDFDDEGFLWMRKNDTVLIKVDVTSNVATSTPITFTGSAIQGVDMGWINDTMYSVNGNTLVRIDLNSMTVSHKTIQDLNSPSGKGFPTSGSYGAVFSNRADELYASNNDTGRIYRITDYDNNDPQVPAKATWVVDAQPTNNNDGAACKLAPSPFDSPTAADDSYSVVNEEVLTVPTAGVFNNDGASTPTISSHTNPSSGTLVLNSDGSFTYTPNPGFVGTDTFTYVGIDQWGRTMPAATVTISVTASANTSTTTTVKKPVITSETLPRSGTSSLSPTNWALWLVVLGLVIQGAMLYGRQHREN